MGRKQAVIRIGIKEALSSLLAIRRTTTKTTVIGTETTGIRNKGHNFPDKLDQDKYDQADRRNQDLKIVVAN